MGTERDAGADVRAAAVDDRFALIAHELLTPLVVAQGYSALLDELLAVHGGEVGGDAGEAGELSLAVTRNLDLAMLLLQRLRDTAGGSEGLELDLRAFDLATLVERTVADLAATVAADHPVTTYLPENGAVELTADEIRIRQVLFNLVVNAVKYSEAGAPIHVTLDTGDGGVTVEIRDHGFGVAPTDAERLFERGTRGSCDGPSGLGVGLYVSRMIAEAHGGTLGVEPADVRGSRFILWLPAR